MRSIAVQIATVLLLGPCRSRSARSSTWFLGRRVRIEVLMLVGSETVGRYIVDEMGVVIDAVTITRGHGLSVVFPNGKSPVGARRSAPVLGDGSLRLAAW